MTTSSASLDPDQVELEPTMVPLDSDFEPDGYKPGPDDPGPIESEQLHGDAETPEPLDA